MFSPEENQDRKPSREVPAWLQRLSAPAGSELPLPRCLLVFAHPDDEVLAVGARLERMRASRLLTVTDGAPVDGGDARHHGFADLQTYRDARRKELQCALRHAGLQEEVAPPFAQAVPDQAASAHLITLARAIAEEMESFQPDAVLTHPYEGGHPDHDACAFAVHAAVRLCAGSTPDGAPVPIAEAPFYHAGEGGFMLTGQFLKGVADDTLCRSLTPEEQANKSARLACFASQAETLAQFGVEQECFRVAPAYDFTQSPHEGTLLYECFPWGMTGERFRRAAQVALDTLFPQTTHSISRASTA